MPLPLLLIGAALIAGGTGVAKGVGAAKTTQKAKDLTREAEKIFDKAKEKLEKARKEASASLEQFGKLKLEIWDGEISRFVTLFEKLKDVELTGDVSLDELARKTISKAELLRMRDVSLKAGELVSGGLGAVGSGALIGVASYGGVATFAAASTGTAISTLGGAAATNATLAWLGGGALGSSAGAMGMAGGAAVLGGLVAGPALLVGGAVLSAKAKAGLAKARANYAEAEKAVEELKTAKSAVRGIGRIAGEFSEATRGFRERFRSVLDRLSAVIDSAGTAFPTYTKGQKEIVWLSVECAGVMKSLLETPILGKDGEVDGGCSKALELPTKVTQKIAHLEDHGAATPGMVTAPPGQSTRAAVVGVAGRSMRNIASIAADVGRRTPQGAAKLLTGTLSSSAPLLPAPIQATPQPDRLTHVDGGDPQAELATQDSTRRPEVIEKSRSMSVSLKKGSNVSLSKKKPGLKAVMIGLGWDTRGTDGQDFDLDAIVFILGSDGKVRSDNDFVFYNNLTGADGAVHHQGDNLTGQGDGDDEQVRVDIRSVASDVTKIVVGVTIHEADQRGQSFGQVGNAFVRVADADGGEEIARYDLSEDVSTETAMIFGELYRRGGNEWKFRAVGQGFAGGLGPLARSYGVDIG